MQIKKDALNILASYAYLRNDKAFTEMVLFLSEEGMINLLVDSGAFTAFRSNKPIDLDKYIGFCKNIDGKVWQYIMLDVIQNHTLSIENLNKMVDAGLKPMPVWTVTDSVDSLKNMFKINEHICVAGGVDQPVSKMIHRFRTACKEVPGIKIHGLGFVKIPEFYKLPLFSVDSSSYSAGQRFGTASVFNKKNKRIELLTNSKLLLSDNASDISRDTKEWWLSMGLMPKDRKLSKYHRGGMSVFNLQTIKCAVDMHNYVKTIGRQYFFAVAGVSHLVQVLTMYYMAKEYGNTWSYDKAIRIQGRIKQAISNQEEFKSLMRSMLK
jgi:hypothetical protein